jgi:hypothetical protein
MLHPRPSSRWRDAAGWLGRHVTSRALPCFWLLAPCWKRAPQALRLPRVADGGLLAVEDIAHHIHAGTMLFA